MTHESAEAVEGNGTVAEGSKTTEEFPSELIYRFIAAYTKLKGLPSPAVLLKEQPSKYNMLREAVIAQLRERPIAIEEVESALGIQYTSKSLDQVRHDGIAMFRYAFQQIFSDRPAGEVSAFVRWFEDFFARQALQKEGKTWDICDELGAAWLLVKHNTNPDNSPDIPNGLDYFKSLRILQQYIETSPQVLDKLPNLKSLIVKD